LLVGTQSLGTAFGTVRWSSFTFQTVAGTITARVVFNFPIFASIADTLLYTFLCLVEPHGFNTNIAHFCLIFDGITVVTAVDTTGLTMAIGEIVS
jgi:hypothetical protein